MITNLNNLIENIKDNKPLSVVRLGNVEIVSLLKKQGIYNQMYTNAGFYGGEEIYKIWKKLYVEALIKSDCLLDVYSCNSFQITGDLLVKLNLWKPTLPYIEDPSWWVNILSSLEETIGIVSYFKKDIEEQIPKLDKIWRKKNLNKLKFTVVKSYQSIEGNAPHEDWNETFTQLKKKVDKHPEIKVWFISCGCYGLPLTNYLKEKGCRAIYVGGILQMFFGLKGKRWLDRKEANVHFNSLWKFPSEKPENATNVEDSCYWGN